MVQGDYSYNVHNNKRYNLSVERPNTHLTSTAENYSNKWLALNDLARKEGQSFKAGQQPPKFNTNRQQKSRTKYTHKTKQSATNFNTK